MSEKCKACNDTGLMIIKTATMVRRHADKNIYMNQLKKVTGPNGWILRYLEEREGEDVYQKDIEEQFSVTRSTVSKVLKGMEAKGLLSRENVSSDARLKKISLTEEGRMISRHAAEERAALEKRITKGLTNEEIETLQRLLRKIICNLIEK